MELQIVQTRRGSALPLWACAVVGLWSALGAAAVFMSRQAGVAVELCLFKRITGIPCPTCGTTRGVLALLSGRPLAAWAFNPLVFTVLGVWILLTLVRMATGRSLRLRLSVRKRAVAWAAVAAAVAVNWLYVILYVG